MLVMEKKTIRLIGWPVPGRRAVAQSPSSQVAPPHGTAAGTWYVQSHVNIGHLGNFTLSINFHSRRACDLVLVLNDFLLFSETWVINLSSSHDIANRYAVKNI